MYSLPMPQGPYTGIPTVPPFAAPTNGTPSVPPPPPLCSPMAVSDRLFDGFRASDAVQGALPGDISKSMSSARSLMQPQDLAIRLLPAAVLLQLLQFANQGCPVDTSKPWAPEVIP